jgi:transposase-like protein
MRRYSFGLRRVFLMDDTESRSYPEPKQRDLSDDEKAQLRARIERGDTDIALAAEFGCSPSQVAGIKAAMRR